MLDEIIARLRTQVAVELEIDHAEVSRQPNVAFLLAVTNPCVAYFILVAHRWFHCRHRVHRRRCERRRQTSGRVRGHVRLVQVPVCWLGLFTGVDARFRCFKEFLGWAGFHLLEGGGCFLVDRFEEVVRIGAASFLVFIVELPFVLQMGECLDVEFVEILRILNGDDVVAREGLVGQEIGEVVHFEVQAFDRVVTVDVARGAYRDDVRALGEDFEGDGTVDFALGIAMEVQFDQLFGFELLAGDRIATWVKRGKDEF